ncbi:MAG: DinB family protein [Vicinamibacterales bacterium]
MTEPAHLADLLTRVMTGDPWHGPNVDRLLDGLTSEEAVQRPVPGGHSIWELVLHMTGWAREVEARLAGAAAGEPPAGDWPDEPSPPDAAAWARDRRALFAAHESLATAIRRVTPAMLDSPVVDHRDRAAGTGLSKYLTLHGLVHHSVYHAGQIAQLRRAIRG